MRVAMFGDVVGRPGRRAALHYVARLRADDSVARPDFVVLNGENSAGGIGITPEVADELLAGGVDVVTTGNHVWAKKEMADYLLRQHRVLRPYNYPPDVPGRGWCIVNANGYRLAVLNLQGRTFMHPIDCPFRAADRALEEIGDQADAVVVEFHAEATSEKQALAMYLDGRVAAVVGTHTHVPTADERVLPGGTARLTDLGMCGPVVSVIGMDADTVIPKFMTALPSRFSVASGPVAVMGAIIEIHHATGKCHSISRIMEEYDDTIR
ncbi:MAG: TIGR00282 family metallophosphoesterase [Firmicutes bacterium]|nr:TIGR00282 family metallophosphoesterase [Bacillota bacterium]